MGQVLCRLLNTKHCDESDEGTEGNSLLHHDHEPAVIATIPTIAARPETVRLWAHTLGKRRSYFSESVCFTTWNQSRYKVVQVAYVTAPMLPTCWYVSTRADGPDGLQQQFRAIPARNVKCMLRAAVERDGALELRIDGPLLGSGRMRISCPSLNVDVDAVCQRGVHNEPRELAGGTWKQTAYNQVDGHTGHVTLTQCDAPPTEVMDGCVIVRFRGPSVDLDATLQKLKGKVTAVRGTLRVGEAVEHLDRAEHRDSAWAASHEGRCRRLNANLWVATATLSAELALHSPGNQLAVVDLMEPMPSAVRQMCRLLGKRLIVHTHVGTAEMRVNGPAGSGVVHGTFIQERHVSF